VGRVGCGRSHDGNNGAELDDGAVSRVTSHERTGWGPLLALSGPDVAVLAYRLRGLPSYGEGLIFEESVPGQGRQQPRDVMWSAVSYMRGRWAVRP